MFGSHEHLDELEAQLDELVALDLPAVDDHALDEGVRRFGRLLARLEAESLRHAGEWERRGLWAANGSRSARACLARHWGTSVVAAGDRLQVAARLRHAPATTRLPTASTAGARNHIVSRPSSTSTTSTTGRLDPCWPTAITRSARAPPNV